MWNCWDAEFFSQCKMFRLLRKEKKKKGTNVGVCGELHIERGSIVWLIRKWVQSMCFGSIFTCFGGISIENWNLALCLGITSLQSERQALIWSETHQLSAFAHSNTAQQLKAGHTNTTSHGNSSVVEPFWAARINKQYSGFYKKRKLFSRLYFFLRGISSLLPQKLWDTPVLQKLQGNMHGSKVQTQWKSFLIMPAEAFLSHAPIWQDRNLALIFP